MVTHLLPNVSFFVTLKPVSDLHYYTDDDKVIHFSNGYPWRLNGEDTEQMYSK